MTYGSTLHFEPFTEWVPVTGLNNVMVVWSNRSEKGSFQSQPAYQLAEVRTDKPDDWVAFGTLQPNEGAWAQELSLATAALNESHYYVRFGIAYKASATNGGASVTLYTSFHRPAKELGTRELSVHVDTTTTQFVELTPWVSAVGVAEAKAAFVVTDATANHFKYGLAYRTASTDRSAPDGAWAVLGSLTTVTTANSERLMSDTAITLTGDTWVQFGLAIAKVTNDAQATVRCSVAVRQ